jgi:hypothetical protein
VRRAYFEEFESIHRIYSKLAVVSREEAQRDETSFRRSGRDQRLALPEAHHPHKWVETRIISIKFQLHEPSGLFRHAVCVSVPGLCRRRAPSAHARRNRTVGDKLDCQEENSPDHQLRPLNDR